MRLLQFLPILFSTLVISTITPVPIHTYQKTWLENIAIRPNGNLLTTALAPAALIYQVNTTTGASTLLHNFTTATGCAGITEYAPDSFAVVVSHLNLANLSSGAGTNEIWSVVFNTASTSTSSVSAAVPTIKKVATITDSIFLNGLAVLSPGVILAADSVAAAVFKITISTGAYSMVISGQPLMTPETDPTSRGVGVNGLKVDSANGWLYWSNTDQSLLAGIPIDANGTAVGKAVTITTGLTFIDDFVIADAHPAAVSEASSGAVIGGPTFVAAGDDAVRLVKCGGAVATLVNGSYVTGSTSLIQAGNSFFVSGNGGIVQWFTGNLTSPEVLSEVTVPANLL